MAFLFKNGTSVKFECPLSMDELNSALDKAEKTVILDSVEKDPKISKSGMRADRDDILAVTIFEYEETPILEISKKIIDPHDRDNNR